MDGKYTTKISKKNLSEICSRHMTPSEIIQFLESGAICRSFSSVLQEVCPGADLAKRLREELIAQSEVPLSGKEVDTIRKNVNNWLNGTTVPQNREQLFKICFALGLSESAANRVLTNASDMGIHYRNPKELVYAFALRTGMTYSQAVALNQRMEQIYRPAVEAGEAARKAQWKAREQAYRDRRSAARRQWINRNKQGGWREVYIPQEEEVPPTFLTQQVSQRFEGVTDLEGLEQFFWENGTDLGTIHESAYEKFWRLLLTLQEPDDMILSDDGGAVYSLDQIAEDYFRMHIPLTKNTAKLNYLQKTIKKNWPGATELQKMKNRKIDISRKAMILLFLITEDFLFSEDLDFDDESEGRDWNFIEEEEARDQMEIALSKINLFLKTYGMNQLDPGSPFDCLVIYALASVYEDGFLTDKFKSALAALFPSNDE